MLKTYSLKGLNILLLFHTFFFPQVVSLLATVVEHLVTGETMQMTSSSNDRCRCVIFPLINYDGMLLAFNCALFNLHCVACSP